MSAPTAIFVCATCNCIEELLAGPDDRVASCLNCGDLMARRDPVDFRVYFPEKEEKDYENQMGR